MPKFKISFYRTVPEYAHAEIEAPDRKAAENLAEDMLDHDDLEWVGGDQPELEDTDLEYDVEEVSDAG